jgi:hypothetical protein
VIMLPSGATRDINGLAKEILAHPSAWFRALLRLRDGIVAPFGIKTTSNLLKEANRGAGMRAVQFYEFGDPAKVLKLIEAEKPSPKPGEALIRMQLRPINPFELSLVRGTYRIKPPLLAAVGFEGGRCC